MKAIGQVAKESLQQLENPPLAVISKQREETAKCIAVALTQAFDTQKTYGADPESMKSRIVVFTRLLGGYSQAKVQSAIDYFFENNSGLPEPSDILKIIRAREVYNAPEYEIFQPKTREEITAEQKEAIRGHVNRCREILGSKKEKAPPATQYFKFENLPEEDKQFYRGNFIESAKKLKTDSGSTA